MRDADGAATQEWQEHGLETPFAEASFEGGARDEAQTTSAVAWNEAASPFAEAVTGEGTQSEVDRQVAELFDELRDEAFDEAVAYLAEETERDVSDRFANEGPSSIAERERFADSRLQEVRYEAERYLDSLAEGVQQFELSTLNEQQLEEMLERFEPQPNEVTPAGEEFIGALARKAKSAIKHVVKTAKKLGSLVGPLLAPVLNKLKAFGRKILSRVLSIAIGRIPAPLRPAARALAKRLTGETEQENEELGEGGMSPANFSDPEMLAEEFDAALAEAIVTDPAGEMEQEEFAGSDEAGAAGTQQLLYLAEARGELIDRLAAAEPGENLAPAVEQFIPALLGALRLGVQLIGRPKVVNFLAEYVGKLIGKWVEPKLSGPLATAIVDTGMKMMMMEDRESGRTDEAAPVALAAVVEDTVRRLAEHEEFVFEDEQLMQLAAADSFAEAVSSHFPQQFVRPDLQRAPSLGGTFVARRPRALRSYRKFTRVPEVQVTSQMADALPAFGGTSVAAAVRALGGTFPIRARMHIFQAAPGTTLAAIGRSERGAGAGAPDSPRSFYPLTPQAAGMLLSEPRLGARVPRRFLRSARRIAAGQRVYFLEPVGPAGLGLDEARPADRAALARSAPSRAWVAINYARGRITLGLYFSEVEAQKIASAIRTGGGASPLLRAILQACRNIGVSTAPRLGQNEDHEEFEEEEQLAGGALRRWMPQPFGRLIRRRIAAWAMPALARWSRDNSSAFVQAAGDPAGGVTVRVKLTAIPGFDVLRQLRSGKPDAGGATSLFRALKGTPHLAITVTPGRRRK